PQPLGKGTIAMSAAPLLDDESLPPDLVLYIDQACDRFETALRQGQRPAIEQYLATAPEVAAPFLLQELVALELAWGCAATLPVYQQRFSEHRELLAHLFATDGAKSIQLPWLTSPVLPATKTFYPATPQAVTGKPVFPTKRGSGNWLWIGLLLAG